MRKGFGLIAISIICIYIVSFGSGFSFNERELPISTWSLGIWNGATEFTHSGKTYFTNVKVDFINSKRMMVYLSQIPDEDEASELFYGIPYSYEYTSLSRISLTSRGRADWELIKNRNHLIIDDVNNSFFELPITLTRTPRFNRLLVFLMAIILIGIYLSGFPEFRKISKEEISDNQSSIRRKILARSAILITSSLSGLLGFRAGIFLLSIVIHLNYFFFFGMPWGQFYILEIAFSLLLIGTRIVTRVYRNAGIDILLPSIVGKYCLGTFLVSSSIYGILAGMSLWGVFFIRSCGYTGICFVY